ncbi:MAG: hypothetical protein WC455_28505 [Dehalococcoidia bacterium]|jgi:hypothetical protein
MASETDICNLALLRVKSSKFINGLGTDTGLSTELESNLCALLYPLVRDQVLEVVDWDFARRRSVLTLYGTSSGDGTYLNPKSPTNWEFSYLLPTDFVKAREVIGVRNPVHEQLIPYEVGTDIMLASPSEDLRLLYTDQEEAELLYTAQITYTNGFTPLFISAVAAGMAVELNMSLSRGLDDTKLRQLYQMELIRASASNYNEGQPDLPPDGDMIRAFQ